MKNYALLLVSLLAFAPSVAAADEKEAPKAGVRITVPLSEQIPTCTDSPHTIDDLGKAYFTEKSDDFTRELTSVLTRCANLDKNDKYVVVVFTASATKGAEKPSIIHVVLRREGESTTSTWISGFPGVGQVSWVYLTDNKTDEPRIQLFVAPEENPLLKQVGPLAAAVVPILGKVDTNVALLSASRPVKPPVRVFAARVTMDYRRATISETDYIGRTVENKDDDDKKMTLKDVEYEGDASFANVPLTLVTIHAGVGLLTGTIGGAKAAKVDDGKYVSDPLNRAATIAGVAFHKPFDSTAPKATFAERFGIVVGAVLTPAAGIYVGPSYGWRGFSFTIGGAFMWSHTPPDGSSIGDAVKEGSGTDQLVYGSTRALLIGGTYEFGK